MPRCQALLRRGSQYYLNLKVPAVLQSVFGKQIRRSLLTSDYSIARREVIRRLDEQLEKFDQARRAMKAGGHLKEAPPAIPSLGALEPKQAHTIAARYLALEERKFREWMETEGHLQPERLDDLHTSLGEDAHDLITQSDGPGGKYDGTQLLDLYLKEQGIECDPSSLLKYPAVSVSFLPGNV
jgi:hypothetical protein